MTDGGAPKAAESRSPQPGTVHTAQTEDLHLTRVEASIRRLAINYSAAPWRIRDCDDPDCAARVYSSFGHLVLGAGLERPSHPSHRPTAKLVRAVRAAGSAEIWGYISIGSPSPDGTGATVGELLASARRWEDLGATGIFIDEYDLCDPLAGNCLGTGGWPVTRARQVALVEGIHALGLPVFANSGAVTDALGRVDGLPSPLGSGDGSRPPDMYLLENPTVAGGRVWAGQDRAWTEQKFRDAARLATRAGVRLAAVDTVSGWCGDGDDALFQQAATRAIAAGVQVYGWTNEVYSATPALEANLPIPPLPGD